MTLSLTTLLCFAALLNVVDQLGDIDWLPSDDSGDDNDESLAAVDGPAADAAADDDNDDVLSIDVQDSPLVGAGFLQVTGTRLAARQSQVCRTWFVEDAGMLVCCHISHFM